MHGHDERSSAAKYQRADTASHFILKLACCGGSSDEDGKGWLNDDAESRRDRLEWFVRAERDLFQARLRWHVQGTIGRWDKSQVYASSTFLPCLMVTG